MIVNQVVGLLVFFNVVSPTASSDLVSAIIKIIGAIFMVVPAVIYIFNRTWLKVRAMQEETKVMALPDPPATLTATETTPTV